MSTLFFGTSLNGVVVYLSTLYVLMDILLIVLLSITGVLQVPRLEEEIANETLTYKVAISFYDSFVKIFFGNSSCIINIYALSKLIVYSVNHL